MEAPDRIQEPVLEAPDEKLLVEVMESTERDREGGPDGGEDGPRLESSSKTAGSNSLTARSALFSFFNWLRWS